VKLPRPVGSAITEDELLTGYGPKIAAAVVVALLCVEAWWIGWIL
jgi:hypothetical protein